MDLSQLLQQIFDVKDPIGRTIVTWIRVFFWVGIGNYAFHILRLGYNFYCLRHVKKYIKVNHVFDEISPDLPNNLGRSALIRFSGIYRRVQDLVSVKQNGGEIDNDTLGDIHAGVASRKAGLSNYILGVLIILGLVGTLSGLMTAVSEVQPLLQDISDPDQLPKISDALQKTLNGMGTAFKTTLAGLVTSFGLGAVGWFFGLLNSAFLTRFERFVTTEIVPHFKQTSESKVETSMDQLQANVREFKLATEDNVRKMQEAIQQLTEKSWDTYLEQQYVIANELREIPKELRESLSSINEYQVLIKSTLEAFNKLTADFVTDVSENRSVINTMVEEFRTLINSSMSQVAAYQAALDRMIEDAVPQFQDQTDDLKATIREAQDAQTAFIEHLADTLMNRMQPITEQQQDMMEALHQTTVNIQRLDGELQIRSALERQSELLESIGLQLSGNRREVENKHGQLMGALEAAFEKQNGVSENIRLQLIQNQQGTDDRLLQLMEVFDITHVLERQRELLESIGVQLSGNRQEIENKHGQLMGALEAAFERQNGVSEDIRLQLIQNQQGTDDRLLQLMEVFDITHVLEKHHQVSESIRSQLVQNQQEIDSRFLQLIGALDITPTLERQNQVSENIRLQLVRNQQEADSRLLQLLNAVQTQERDTEVLERIESHLEVQRELVQEQRRLMDTLDSSMNRLQQTFSKVGADQREQMEKMTQRLTLDFVALKEQMDILNRTMSQPGLYRWGSEVRRLFGKPRK